MSSRQLHLNKKKVAQDGACVLYVMSRDQRVHDNHALLFAQRSAIDSELPLVVLFNLLPSTGVRAREHYQFMIKGLKKLAKDLSNLDISFALTFGDAEEQIMKQIKTLRPNEVFFDFNPLNGPRQMQKAVAKAADMRVTVVDTHNIIPVWVASDKEEFAAHTIRKKVHEHLETWLIEPDSVKKHPHNGDLGIDEPDWSQADTLLEDIDTNGIELDFEAGEQAGREELETFIEERLATYAAERNKPTVEGQSKLSPYLHFGQLSAIRAALEVMNEMEEPPLLMQKAKLASYEDEPTKADSINAFLEELIVRKELSDNYCFYNSNYASINGAKDWARETLEAHKDDEREYTYTQDELESAQTHDDAWNAAQNQMMKTGKMHGYMRMYWAKKILEWSKTPEHAIQAAVYLNDHYSIDGGDPNGYIGIMWSIAGVHDRAWTERPVYGKIRYMNANGLKRKFDVDEYVSMWSS